MTSIIDPLLQLVELSKASQRRFGHHYQGLTPKHWLKEVCTIKCGGPRGSGHTTAMTMLASAYPNDRLLLITNWNRFLPELRHAVRDTQSMVFSCEQRSFLSIPRDKEGKWSGVIVDTANQTPVSVIEDLYEFAASKVQPGQAFFFILLG